MAARVHEFNSQNITNWISKHGELYRKDKKSGETAEYRKNYKFTLHGQEYLVSMHQVNRGGIHKGETRIEVEMHRLTDMGAERITAYMFNAGKGIKKTTAKALAVVEDDAEQFKTSVKKEYKKEVEKGEAVQGSRLGQSMTDFTLAYGRFKRMNELINESDRLANKKELTTEDMETMIENRKEIHEMAGHISSEMTKTIKAADKMLRGRPEYDFKATRQFKENCEKLKDVADRMFAASRSADDVEKEFYNDAFSYHEMKEKFGADFELASICSTALRQAGAGKFVENKKSGDYDFVIDAKFLMSDQMQVFKEACDKEKKFLHETLKGLNK